MDEPLRLIADAEPANDSKMFVGQGAIGEALAAAELLRRGLSVARPLHDAGTDLVVFRGQRALRIQVKTTATLHQGRARFKLCRGAGRTRPPVDIWIFHALDLNAWWIMPDTAIDNGRYRQGKSKPREDISAGGGRAELDRWRDAWHVFEELLG